MDSHLSEQIKKLSIAERILLVEEIWDSIARENESFELSQVQRDEIDRRIASFEANPTQGRTWEEIKAEFMRAR